MSFTLCLCFSDLPSKLELNPTHCTNHRISGTLQSRIFSGESFPSYDSKMYAKKETQPVREWQQRSKNPECLKGHDVNPEVLHPNSLICFLSVPCWGKAAIKTRSRVSVENLAPSSIKQRRYWSKVCTPLQLPINDAAWRQSKAMRTHWSEIFQNQAPHC